MESKNSLEKNVNTVSVHTLFIYLIFSVESAAFSIFILALHPFYGILFSGVLILPILLYEREILRNIWLLNFEKYTELQNFQKPAGVLIAKNTAAFIIYALILNDSQYFIPIKIVLNSIILTFCAFKDLHPHKTVAFYTFSAIEILFFIDNIPGIINLFFGLLQCLVLFLLDFLCTKYQEITNNIKNKNIHNFIMSFPDPIIILNEDNSLHFKNEEAYALIDKINFAPQKTFEKFIEVLMETGMGANTLKQNIEQFRKDILSTYQNKLQWTHDYYIEEEITIQNHFSTKSPVLKRKDRKYIHVTMVWLKDPLFLTQDKKELILFLNDITEKGALQTQKIADNMKSVLISTISHELRTPLNGIIGILNVICEKLSPDIKDWWNAAYISAQLLLNTVNCMLDFSQLEMQKFCLHNGTINIKQIIDEMVELFEGIITKDKVSLRSEIAAGVPARFRTDTVRFKQVLMNLMSNAVNFTFNGAITIQASMQEPDLLRIDVIDTGVGISRDVQQNLFKLFGNTKTEPTNSACKLAGLGLTVSSSIIREMGGTITVKSTVNIGSTFTFTVKEMPMESPKLKTRRLRNGSIDTVLKEKFIKPVKMIKIKKNTYIPTEEERKNSIHSLIDKSIQLRHSGLKVLPLMMPCNFQTEDSPIEKKEETKKVTENSESESDSDSEISKNSENEGSICDELKLSGDIIESVKLIQRAVSKNNFSFAVGTHKLKALSADLNKMHKRRSLKPNEVLVLVVDDSSINRLVLSGMLRNLGYKPQEACNGQEVCKMVLNNGIKFDIILMDVQMPLMDGIEATYKIRQKYEKSEIPIIAVTALSSELELQKCVDAGMNDTMTKPLSLVDVKTIMQKYHLLSDMQESLDKSY